MGQSKIKLWPIYADPFKNFCDLCTQDEFVAHFQIASTRKLSAVGAAARSPGSNRTPIGTLYLASTTSLGRANFTVGSANFTVGRANF